MQRNLRKYTLANVLWERDVWRNYYDGLEAIGDGWLEDAERFLHEALCLNPNFPGSYEALAVVAKKQGNEAEARNLTTLAFEKALAPYTNGHGAVHGAKSKTGRFSEPSTCRPCSTMRTATATKPKAL